jgi:hypothetical protein
MLHREAAHVRLVDHHVRPGDVRRLVVAPGEGRVDDPALGHAGGVVTTVEGKILVAVTNLVTEMGIAPAHLADDILGVGLDEQFVAVEAVAARRVVGTIHPVAVEQAGARLGQVAVPDQIGLLAQLDTLHFAAPVGIEKTQFDAFGVFGKEGEVDAFAVPGSAAWSGSARPDGGDGKVHGWIS